MSQSPYYQMQSNNNNLIDSSTVINGSQPLPILDSSSIKLSIKEFDDKYSKIIEYLNEELTILGMPPILTTETSPQLHICSLINVCSDLITLYRRSMRNTNDYQDRNLMVTRELEVSQRRHRQTQRKFEEAQRALDLNQEKEHQQNRASKTVMQQLKREKDEVSRLKSCLAQKEMQYKHEKKKLERELSSLKDHLHNTVANQSTLKKSVMYLNGSSAIEGLREPGARKKWMTPKVGPTLKSQEEFQNELHKQREARETELLLENRDLRECIIRMKSQFEGLLYVDSYSPVMKSDLSQGEFTNSSVIEDSQSNENIEDMDDTDSILENLSLSSTTQEQHLYDMPYDIMKTTLEKDLRHLLKRLVAKRLKDRKLSSDSRPVLSSTEADHSSDISLSATSLTSDKSHLQEEVSSLKLQVSRYEQVIQKQEEMLKRAIGSRPKSAYISSPPVSNSSPIPGHSTSTRPTRQLPSLPSHPSPPALTRKLSVQDEHLKRQREILELNLRQHEPPSGSTSLKRCSLNTTTFLIKNSSNQSLASSQPDSTSTKSFISKSNDQSHLLASRLKQFSKDSSDYPECNSFEDSNQLNTYNSDNEY